MYYLVIAQNNDTQTVYRYNTLDDALVTYHSELAYRADDRTSTKCAILDAELRYVMGETYTKETAPVQITEATEG